jgi:hypothetical protein
MRRREFITLLGGAAAAWPLAARAQQAIPAIGYLSASTPDGYSDWLRALREGLGQSGYVEGENIVIDYRWAENEPNRLPVLAEDLVRQRDRRAQCPCVVGSSQGDNDNSDYIHGVEGPSEDDPCDGGWDS